MLTEISPNMTLAEIAIQNPACCSVFEELHIDYCCGGDTTLYEICAQKNIAPEELIMLLQKSEHSNCKDAFADINTMSLNELIDNIINQHHFFLREELPLLQGIIEKVARVHGEKDQRLAETLLTFSSMREELESHMLKEENVLFPAIRKIESSSEIPLLPFPSIVFPIEVMENEHANVGDDLEKLSKLLDSYSAPEWACQTFRTMLMKLQELEIDLHQHIHKENNILFPKATLLEIQRRAHD